MRRRRTAGRPEGTKRPPRRPRLRCRRVLRGQALRPRSACPAPTYMGCHANVRVQIARGGTAEIDDAIDSTARLVAALRSLLSGSEPTLPPHGPAVRWSEAGVSMRTRPEPGLHSHKRCGDGSARMRRRKSTRYAAKRGDKWFSSPCTLIGEVRDLFSRCMEIYSLAPRFRHRRNGAGARRRYELEARLGRRQVGLPSTRSGTGWMCGTCGID